MEEKHAIEVKDLVISYQNLKKTSIKKTLLHLKRQKPDRFVAVKGISFYVREGEILGIIGKNGSGKSTTLNALAGIFSPDSGSIDLNGHSISLLSIGVGFIREMTGRENITLSGMLLGFTEEQVKAKEQEIIDFAEIIHINKHDRDYRIFLFCASYEISKKAHEIIPVVKSGHDIIIRHISQFIILVLQL